MYRKLHDETPQFIISEFKLKLQSRILKIHNKTTVNDTYSNYC